ncbi:hypothetical protein [Streptomyces macrosporus]|uniref:hypothetical protein n=1 Tax=Streptomyces macrosporus TaxID=44032 RepID=UPI0031D04CBB
MEVCDATWSLRADLTRARNVLAVVPTTGWHLAGDPRPALRALMRQGVVAVAVAAPGAGPISDTLLRAARSMGLPLLTPTAPCTAPEHQTRILRVLAAALRTHAEQRGQLLGLAGRLYQQGEGPGPLLHWLGVQTSSQVTVITGRHTWGDLAQHARLLDDIMAGQIHSAAFQTGTRHVQLHGIGTTPRQVLAAVRDTPWPRPAGELIAQAAGQVALLQHPQILKTQAGRLQRTETTVRISVLQHLMTGETVRAARAAEPLLPGLLTADGCQVGVLECAPTEDRTAVATACEAELGPSALIVLCPAEARPGRALGVSRPVAWTHTSCGYGAAIQALARAREEEIPVCVTTEPRRWRITSPRPPAPGPPSCWHRCAPTK